MFIFACPVDRQQLRILTKKNPKGHLITWFDKVGVIGESTTAND